MEDYYIKATLKKGRSGYDRNFVYHLGENVHPNPDRRSRDACGVGIHLAKNLWKARQCVVGACEFYVARAGDILGEDSEKVRTDRAILLCAVPANEIKVYDEAIASARKACNEATAPAEKVYNKATAPAQKVYYEVRTAPAQKVYDEAKTSAQKVYNKATALAEKVYDEAKTSAQKALIRNSLKGVTNEKSSE